MLLTAFRSIRPKHEASQEEILAWLVDAHGRAARREARDPSFDGAAFDRRLARLVRHVCCGSDRIATRGFSVPREHDATSPIDAGSSARTDWFAREVDAIFERLYPRGAEPPEDLIHVTCTGYVAPSGAQRLVASRGWGERTRVTHAYHMGCYASVPAMRIAIGLARTRVDVVHTELCSLHFDASIHTPEQLVVQSLFGDGVVRYSVVPDGAGLEVLALRETIEGGTEDAMQWRPGDRGMRMMLSRDVPSAIARTIRPFVAELFARAGRDFARERESTLFAVHPGGPKIIDVVADALELRDAQIAASRAALRRYGNMSSATLPHVWKAILEDRDVPSGTMIASFAFGPGLTVCGALLRKKVA